MTMPNKEEGITPGLLWTVSDPNNTTYDLADTGDFGGLTERLGWRSQANVTDFLKARIQQSSSWKDSTDKVWGTNLRRGTPENPVPLWLAQLEAFVKQLLPVAPGDPDPVYGTEDDALGALQGWGQSVNQTGLDLLDTWNMLVGGYTHQAITDATLGDVERIMFDINRDITNTQSATITLANLANAPKNVPEWVSPNPFEDVSYPRALLTKVVDFTEIVSFTASPHSHSVSNGTYVVPAVTGAAAEAYFNTVSCTYDRIYNTAGFTTVGGSTLPTSVFLSIWKVNPVTGAATLEYDFGNVRSLMATGVAGNLVDQRFNTTVDIAATAGEKRRVVMVPVGGPLDTGAIRRTTVENTGFYPLYSSGRLAGQTGTPSSPVADSALASSTFRVWACLGQALEPDLTVVNLIENFAVADTRDWQSSSWQQFSTTNDLPRLRITSGQLYLDGGATLFGWATQRIALHKTRLHTANQGVEITLGTNWDIGAYNFAHVAAVLRATAGATAGVTMQLDSPDDTHVRVRICTHTSGIEASPTVRASVEGIDYQIGDRYRIEVVNEGPAGSPPLYVYRCYRNDVAIPGAVWTDTTNVIPDVDAYRSVGFTAGAYDNGFLIVSHPAFLASWVATDLSDSTP